MDIKVIKTESEYNEALKYLGELLDKNPGKDTVEGEQLELLITLVKDYESRIFPETLPDPIDAIIFRMEQQDLKPRDLIPYIGNKSKVSEILSRKRPLTLSMMRALQVGLGIPAKVLLQEPHELNIKNDDVWEKFPLKLMQKRGYFKNEVFKHIKTVDEKLNEFFKNLGNHESALALLKKSVYVRSPKPMNKYALIAWSARVINKALNEDYEADYVKGRVTLNFMKEVVKLSRDTEGPLKARNFLKENGIALIIEPHLPNTYLDGAAILSLKERPVIGLTIRQDRLDNFWFSLLHELAHIALHSDKGINLFYDDLDVNENIDKCELEADYLAREAMVPDDKWMASVARTYPSTDIILEFANELGIHPSIVAGKVRYERKYYRFLNPIVGHGQVRKLFEDEVNWQMK